MYVVCVSVSVSVCAYASINLFMYNHPTSGALPAQSGRRWIRRRRWANYLYIYVFIPLYYRVNPR